MQGNVTEATLQTALGAKAKQQTLLLLDNADSIAAAEPVAQVNLVLPSLLPLLARSDAHHAPAHASTHALITTSLACLLTRPVNK